MTKLLGSFCVVLLAVSAVSADGVDDLVSRLKAKDTDARRTAAKELSAMGAEAKAAVPALIDAVQKDADTYVRRFSAQALGQIGDPKALTALTAALKDKEKGVAEAAAEALGGLGASAAKPLGDLAKDTGKDDSARLKALQALSKLGKDAKSAVPALIDVLNQKEARRPNQDSLVKTLKLEAVNVLTKIGPDAKDALPKLEEMAAARERDRNFKRAVDNAVKAIKN